MLYNVKYDESSVGIWFPPELQSKEVLKLWDEIGDLLLQLDYQSDTSWMGIEAYEYNLKPAVGTTHELCPKLIDISQKL